MVEVEGPGCVGMRPAVAFVDGSEKCAEERAAATKAVLALNGMVRTSLCQKSSVGRRLKIPNSASLTGESEI